MLIFLNSDSHSAMGEFLDRMLSLMLLPIIFKPTRITANSATLIDNIFTNAPSHSLKSGIFFTDISDHFPIFGISNLNLSKSQKNERCLFRNFNEANRTKFNDKLSHTNWNAIYNSNEAYEAFVDIFSQNYNSCFPLERPNRRLLTSIQKPWISSAHFKNPSKPKPNFTNVFLRRPSSRKNEKYKSYKNRLTKLLRTAKQKYYETQIEKASNDIKQTWKLL